MMTAWPESFPTRTFSNNDCDASDGSYFSDLSECLNALVNILYQHNDIERPKTSNSEQVR